MKVLILRDTVADGKKVSAGEVVELDNDTANTLMSYGKAEASDGKVSEKKDRSAHFQTVLYFYDGKTEISTEGTLEGVITYQPRGINGFGYDSIFEHDSKTLAELTSVEKNNISHRKIAAYKMIGILNEQI